MATRVKESPTAKEKRGTSLSHPPNKETSQIRKSPSTSKQASPAKRNNSTSPSGRQIPNYLKPTKSSRPESSTHHAKKHLPTDTQKSSTSRRKSLDKTLPPSQIPKTRTSPNTRDMKIRSSSFNVSKGMASTKSISNRLPKEKNILNTEKEIHDDIKQQERNNASGLPTKEPVEEIAGMVETHDTALINPMEEKGEDIYSSDTDQVKEDIINNDEMKAGVVVVSKYADENLNSDTDGGEVVEEVKMTESLTILEQEEESMDLIARKQEDKPEDDGVIISEESGEPKTNECHSEENISVPVKEDEAVEERQDEEVKESGTEKDDVKEDQKQDGENAALKPQVVVQGKKDSVVSNDVIEETANRLREQKKNKVRALAGAFETVISFQEPK